MKKDVWQVVPFVTSSELKVSRKSGIYLIAEVRRVHGVPLEIDVLYVGLSKAGLRQRMKQHLNWKSSHSSELWKQISQRDRLEFWFQEIAADQVDHLETHLIQDLGPEFNVQKKDRK